MKKVVLVLLAALTATPAIAQPRRHYYSNHNAYYSNQTNWMEVHREQQWSHGGY